MAAPVADLPPPIAEVIGPDTLAKMQDGCGLMHHVLRSLVEGLSRLEKRMDDDRLTNGLHLEKLREVEERLDTLSVHVLDGRDASAVFDEHNLVKNEQNLGDDSMKNKGIISRVTNNFGSK